MQFTKLQFNPGINRETTPYANEGGWYDCNLVRFRASYPETIGGWQKATNAPMVGTPRGLIGWTTLTGASYIGAGTPQKYYVVRGEEPYDITPIRYTSTSGAATFTAVEGETTLTVTDTSHGAYLGDYVTFSGAVSLGGAITADVLNLEYQIASIIDGNTYTIDTGVAATASDVGDGGSLTEAAYQINVGLESAASGDGWGAGAWSRETWSSAADTSIPGAQLRIWTHDAYGEDLLICPRGGAVYLWDASAGTSARAVALTDLAGATNTPTVAQQVMVSEVERHAIVFGCDSQYNVGVLDPLLIRFSSTESLTDWNIASATNTAGELRLGSGSTFVAALQTKQQIVVFTDSSIHAMQYIGTPYIFGLQEVSSNTSIMCCHAALAVGDVVFWMGHGGFYMYDGTVTKLDCSVTEYVFSNINLAQSGKVCTGHNAAYSEVWWFYPSADSDVNDRYVVYNYMQKVWYYGAMARSAWMDRGTSQYPISGATDGYLYFQEYGLDDGSQNPPVALEPYIESSVIDIGEGDQFMFAHRVVPDLTFRNSTSDTPTATLTIKARNFPGSLFDSEDANPVVKTAEVPIEKYTEQVFVRIRGRSMAVRIESAQTGTAWRLGAPRIDLRTDGRR